MRELTKQLELIEDTLRAIEINAPEDIVLIALCNNLRTPILVMLDEIEGSHFDEEIGHEAEYVLSESKRRLKLIINELKNE